MITPVAKKMPFLVLMNVKTFDEMAIPSLPTKFVKGIEGAEGTDDSGDTEQKLTI